jgi:RNA polymerase-binding transcription factor DksA
LLQKIRPVDCHIDSNYGYCDETGEAIGVGNDYLTANHNAANPAATRTQAENVWN